MNKNSQSNASGEFRMEPDVMSINTVDIVNAATLEKVVLSQRVGLFLKDDHDAGERAAIENVARMLAQDIALQVRESLAFELRTCKQLPYDLAAKIASDVESVATPFLATTTVLSDTELAGLVPHLEDHAHVTLARRSDVGPETCHAIVTFGTEKSVSFVVRNDQITLHESTCETVLKRFRENVGILDQLSCRIDLPISVVEALSDIVSEEYRRLLVHTYSLDEVLSEKVAVKSAHSVVENQIDNASPAQIHAYVIDLRNSGRLQIDLVLDMARKGCLNFLESMLALEAGLTLAAVRQALYSKDMKDYVRIMQQAGMSQYYAQEFRKLVLLKGPDTICH